MSISQISNDLIEAFIIFVKKTICFLLEDVSCKFHVFESENLIDKFTVVNETIVLDELHFCLDFFNQHILFRRFSHFFMSSMHEFLLNDLSNIVVRNTLENDRKFFKSDYIVSS
jgi:hypothetical protein